MEKTITIKCKDIINELGLKDLSPEDKDNLIGQMADIVSSRIVLKAMEKITEKEAKELNDYLDIKNMDKVNLFLKEKVANFSEIIQTELDIFQKEILEKK